VSHSLVPLAAMWSANCQVPVQNRKTSEEATEMSWAGGNGAQCPEGTRALLSLNGHLMAQ
jgi:hypothetical protein